MIQISQVTQVFIREHQTDDVRALALQAKKYPDVDMPTAITQIAGRQVATEKIPSWKKIEDIWYPKHLSLEQCSSETTARYKARLIQGESLVDLTGGFGIDCSFLATRFRSVIYVERQEGLCEIAAHNFPILGLDHISIKNEDGVAYLKTMLPVDCIFIDPARRNEHGGKSVAISDCEPNVAELEELLLKKANKVMVKLSPMLDLSLALKELQFTQEVHIISVNNECKELLLILGQTPSKDIPIHCVNFSTKGEQEFAFSREQEQYSKCVYTDALAQYLYEPNASLLKGGAYKSLSSAYHISKLHPNSHLYTSDSLIRNFPGRVFHIKKYCSFNKKEIKETLGNIEKGNISIRNFPASVGELRKRIKLSDGGSDYVFATTLNNEKKLLILCEKV
ncbi:SAM-dependent methyltransferase [Bacteroides sp.]|uniref:THUMP-like domain-containing protein n=1 Tax=Bacteroides sp. TaxID=29523 RepID=UPI002621C254|nr:SAM-dependent methyltransferase [Bacteroides sp.]MDD3036854.1 SAM-dependent methyltransferase [Bacteroides sp.]